MPTKCPNLGLIDELEGEVTVVGTRTLTREQELSGHSLRDSDTWASCMTAIKLHLMMNQSLCKELQVGMRQVFRRNVRRLILEE